MGLEALTLEILERVVRIENQIADCLELVDRQLSGHEPLVRFLRTALAAEESLLSQESRVVSQREFLGEWFERIRSDQTLRLPHRKVMDYLLSQYDFVKGRFREVHFSRLVKEARVGKGDARGYLDFLVQSGYVRERCDGYRKFYSVFPRRREKFLLTDCQG